MSFDEDVSWFISDNILGGRGNQDYPDDNVFVASNIVAQTEPQPAEERVEYENADELNIVVDVLISVAYTLTAYITRL